MVCLVNDTLRYLYYYVSPVVVLFVWSVASIVLCCFFLLLISLYVLPMAVMILLIPTEVMLFITFSMYSPVQVALSTMKLIK